MCFNMYCSTGAVNVGFLLLFVLFFPFSLFFFFFSCFSLLLFFFARLQISEHELKLSKALKKVARVKAASYSLIRKSNSSD